DIRWPGELSDSKSIKAPSHDMNMQKQPVPHERGTEHKGSNRPSRSSADFVIITALSEERDAVLSKLPGCRRLPATREDIRIYYAAEIETKSPDGPTDKYSVIV